MNIVIIAAIAATDLWMAVYAIRRWRRDRKIERLIEVLLEPARAAQSALKRLEGEIVLLRREREREAERREKFGGPDDESILFRRRKD